MARKMKLYLVFLLSFFLTQSCSPTISPYDQYSYEQTISIKVDALNLMDYATDSIQIHQKEINTIVIEMQKIYEYEKNRPKNTITTAQWKLMNDTTGHLFGGFINRWKYEKVLHKIFIQEAKKDISISFDQISELESKKIKSSQISNN